MENAVSKRNVAALHLVLSETFDVLGEDFPIVVIVQAPARGPGRLDAVYDLLASRIGDFVSSQ